MSGWTIGGGWRQCVSLGATAQDASVHAPGAGGIAPSNNAERSLCDPSAEPGPETLADARDRALLPDDRLAKIDGALGVLAKVAGLAADRLPAATVRLTPIIEEALPARHTREPKTWQNAISRIRELLRACGLHAPKGTGNPSDPWWAKLGP
jgi:hypothetical protein